MRWPTRSSSHSTTPSPSGPVRVAQCLPCGPGAGDLIPVGRRFLALGLGDMLSPVGVCKLRLSSRGLPAGGRPATGSFEVRHVNQAEEPQERAEGRYPDPPPVCRWQLVPDDDQHNESYRPPSGDNGGDQPVVAFEWRRDGPFWSAHRPRLAGQAPHVPGLGGSECLAASAVRLRIDPRSATILPGPERALSRVLRLITQDSTRCP